MTGPVARDLRRAGLDWWKFRERESYRLWLGAVESLGLGDHVARFKMSSVAGDIASEAIEAAEALGL